MLRSYPADEHKPLVNYENKMGHEGILAVPTPDYLPLLYVIGTRTAFDRVEFPVDGGSISMVAVQVG